MFEEQWAPKNGDQLSALVGALLYGKSLIIGAGRCVAAQVCLMHDPRADITIVELNDYFKKYCPLGVTWYTVDANQFIPIQMYENLYIDTFPPLENISTLRRLSASVVEAGSIYYIAEYYNFEDFENAEDGWHVDWSMKPSNNLDNRIARLKRWQTQD